MTTLTAEEFLNITEVNPGWAKGLTENVTITGEVILPWKHPLKTLSPKLIFQDHADFSQSEISVAEGVFHQGVNFSDSQIREIGELNVLGTDENGNAASFYRCNNLTVARGTFAGFVDFTWSEIKEISKDLHIIAPNKEGNAASFWQCVNLTVAKGTFPGFVDFSESGIQKISENLRVTAPNKKGNAAEFHNCKDLHLAQGKFCGTVSFAATSINRSKELKVEVPEGTPKAIFTELCLEESPFPLKEILIPKELKEKLRRQIVQKMNKKLKNDFPDIPLGL